MTAIEHNTIPVIPLALFRESLYTKEIIPIISPMVAKGILSQLIVARHGINPMIIPTIDNIPKTKLVVCIKSDLVQMKYKFRFFHKQLENKKRH